MLIDKFHDLIGRASKTMQVATHWQTDPEGLQTIQANLKLYEYCEPRYTDEPLKLMGIMVKVDPNYAPNKVALKSGENTVGEFNIKEHFDELLAAERAKSFLKSP